MPDIRIALASLWVAVMLIYLLGDVLRIFSYDFPDVMDTRKFSRTMWLGVAAMMSVPIVMIPLTVIAENPFARWANIIAAGFFLVFVLFDVWSYPSIHDKFLLFVSMIFKVLIIWYAWNWV